MTVSVPSDLVYSTDGDGVTTTFPYPVRFLDKSEIVVLLRVDGADTTLTLDVDYTIPGSEWPTGGNIVLSAAAPAGSKVVRYRATTPEQIVDLANTQRNDAKAVERQLDRLAMVLQDANEKFDRSLKLAPGADLIPKGHFPIMGSDGRVVDGGSGEDIAAAQENAETAMAARDDALQARDDAMAVGVRLMRKTVPLLLDDTEFAYAPAPGRVRVMPGDIVEAGGFRYIVAASGAVDHHVETTGGVKLYVLPANGELNLVQFGAPTDGVTNAQPIAQMALSVAATLGARLVLDRVYNLTTYAASPKTPDGLSGACCLVNTHSGLTIIGKNGGGFLSPRNVHTFYSVEADDLTIDGVSFARNGTGAAGAVGHHIDIAGKCRRPRIVNCKFKAGDDAAIGFHPHSDKWNAAGAASAEADAFDFGAEDIFISGNYIEEGGAGGDAGIELMAITGGVVSGNVIKNVTGHGIRLVGFKGGVVSGNDILGCATAAAFYAGIAAASGGWGVTGSGRYFIFENAGTLITNNNIIGGQTGVSVGIGECAIVLHNSIKDVTVRPIALTTGVNISLLGDGSLSYVDPTRRSVIRPIVRGNYINCPGATSAVVMVINNTTEGFDIVVGGDIAENEIAFGAGPAINLLGTFGLREIVGLGIHNNVLSPADLSESSNAVALNLWGGKSCEAFGNRLRGRSTYLISAPDANNAGNSYQRASRLKVIRSANRMQAPAGVQTGWSTGTAVWLKTTGTLPAPLSTSSLYYLIADGPHMFRIATSLANALAGIGVALTDDGAGLHWIEVLQ